MRRSLINGKLNIAPHNYEMCNNELYSIIQKEFTINNSYLTSICSCDIANVCFKTNLKSDGEAPIYLKYEEPSIYSRIKDFY